MRLTECNLEYNLLILPTFINMYCVMQLNDSTATMSSEYSNNNNYGDDKSRLLHPTLLLQRLAVISGGGGCAPGLLRDSILDVQCCDHRRRPSVFYFTDQLQTACSHLLLYRVVAFSFSSV